VRREEISPQKPEAARRPGTFSLVRPLTYSVRPRASVSSDQPRGGEPHRLSDRLEQALKHVSSDDDDRGWRRPMESERKGSNDGERGVV